MTAPAPRRTALAAAGPARTAGSRPVTPADLQSAFDNAPIGIAVVTPLGAITGCNDALGALLGVDPADLVGKTFFDVTHDDDLPLARDSCARMQSGAASVLHHECRFLHVDGGVLWVSVSTSRVPEAVGRPAHLIMHVQDIGARKALEAQLLHRALHDPLTGLANRALLLDRVGHALERAGRKGGPVSLLFVDLDGFKAVNDAHGHSAGDEVLVELARRVTSALRPGDTAARLGGDEFVVLCDGAGPEQAAGVADRLRAAAAAPFDLGGGVVVRLGAAVGTSTTRSGQGGARDPVALLREADQQMYLAKRAGEAAGDPATAG